MIMCRKRRKTKEEYLKSYLSMHAGVEVWGSDNLVTLMYMYERMLNYTSMLQ